MKTPIGTTRAPGGVCGLVTAFNSCFTYSSNLNINKEDLFFTNQAERGRNKTLILESQLKGNLIKDLGSNTENKLFIKLVDPGYAHN